MLKHLFSLIWNNRRQNFWLMAGMFLISICLWYAVDYGYSIAVNQTRKLGFDWHHVYSLSVGALTPESDEYTPDDQHTVHGGQDVITFLDRMQNHPAVESVCFTRYHKHYLWTNSSNQYYVDTLKASSWTRYVTPDYFRVFRVEGADGTSPDVLADKRTYRDIIITRNMADKLFPGKEAVGQDIRREDDEASYRVVAVTENQKYNEYSAYLRAAYLFFNMDEVSQMNCQEAMYYGFYMRVRPEADSEEFARTFRKEMSAQLRIGNLYLADMKPMSYYRDEHLKSYRNELYTNLCVAFFFLLNAFFAVLGTFWTRTQQRYSELGLRIALGSSKVGLSHMLWGEGLLLLTLAFIPAAIVCYNLGISDLVATWPVEFTAVRFFIGLGITYLLLALITLLSIWFPARQAMKVEPAEALHNE